MTGHFGGLMYFTPPLIHRYGPVNSAEEYLTLSQAASYESHRAMFDGYIYYKYVNTTGVFLFFWDCESADMLTL